MTFDAAIRIQSAMEELLQDKEYDVSSLDILSLANSSTASAYDCEFIALAKNFNTSLVTMDKKLANAFPETAVLLTDAVDR